MADHGSTRRGLQSPFYQDQADDEVGLEYREMLPWGEYQSPECLNRFVAGSEPSSSSSAFRQQVTIASPSRHENRNLVGPQGSAHCAGEITIRPLVQIDSDCARDVYDRGTPAFPLASIPFSPALGDQYDHGQVQMRLDNVDFFSQRWHQNPPQSFEEAHSDSNSSHTGYHGSPLSVFSTLQAGYRVQTQVGNSIGEGHTPDLMTMNPQEIRGLVEHTLECTQPIESTPNAYSSVNFLGASDGHHTTARAIECFEQYTEGSSTRDEPWTPWTMLHEGQGESLRAKYGQEPEEASAFAGGGFERAKDDYSTASSGQRQSTPASSVVSVSIELSDSTVTLRPGTQASASEFSEIVLSPYNGQISSPLGVPMETAPGWSQKPSSAECGSNFSTHLGVPSSRITSEGLVPNSPTPSTGSGTSTIPDVLGCQEHNCGAEFTGGYRVGNLARHIRQKHAGRCEKTYPCEDIGCPKVFKRQDARLKHYRKRHPELGPGPAERRKH